MTLGAGVVTGNVIGFARVALMAYLLGAHSLADSLAVALGPLDTLNSVLINSIVFAFVPMLTARAGTERTALFLSLNRHFARLFTGLTLLVLALAPWLVRLLGPGLDPAWVFKIIYPLIFALVPVGLYALWQRFIGKKYAFFAVFLFVAQTTFYTEMTALNRQMIAELFFVLLLLVLLNKKLKIEVKFLSFALFSFALIFSHYALAEIFLLLIFVAWAISAFYLRRPSFNLQFSMVIFFFTAMFAWYIYTSGGAVFDSFITFSNYVASQLGGFLNLGSRGETVLTGIGLTQSPSLINTVSRGFAYITEIFIALGVIALLMRKTRFRFERDYSAFSLVAAAFLVALTVVPGLANTLDMTRFYHILLMMLAPFCIVGMWTFVEYVFKRHKKAVMSLIVIGILVPYFLFQTNFVYEVAKSDSWSVPLSAYRMDPLRLYGSYGYIDSYSVYGAQWISGNVPYEYNLYADNAHYTALTAYGLIYRGYVSDITNTTVLKQGQFAYLSYISIEYAELYSNTTNPSVATQVDVVYSNGGTDVYCGTG